MFCSKCGTENAETATVCVKCSAPIAAHHSSHAADAMKGAGKDALEAFKMFATDPVPGLPKAFESLGEARALGAGIGFGIVTALCFVAWGYLFFGEFGRPQGFGGFLKTLLWSVVPFASLVGACFLARLVFRGKGGINHDCFIAGAAILPLGVLFLLAGIFGLQHLDVTYYFVPFALCTAVLLLFSGCVRIFYMSERAATIAVPVLLIISGWISKAIYSAMSRSSM